MQMPFQRISSLLHDVTNAKYVSTNAFEPLHSIVSAVMPHMPPLYMQMSETSVKVSSVTDPQHAVEPSSYSAHADPTPLATLATLVVWGGRVKMPVSSVSEVQGSVPHTGNPVTLRVPS
jgi:hypothetical protein